MAGSLLLLLDDIATVLDDVSVMTKVAAKKTTGVLGDDLALNAQQVSGVKADRELPVVWAVARGSARNKCILIPAALLISAFAPWLITPLLMLGGAYLCFEGVEKLAHSVLHRHQAEADQAKIKDALTDTGPDFEQLETDKIKGAIRTDAILSAEIIVITLGTVAAKPFATQLGVLIAIAVLMTVGVYGLVAGIVKLDDIGLVLAQRPNGLARKLGYGILSAAPWLMRLLSVAGTAAMFLVGGGIVSHGIPALHHLNEALIDGMTQPWLTLTSMAWTGAVGIMLGVAVAAGTTVARRLLGKQQPAAH